MPNPEIFAAFRRERDAAISNNEDSFVFSSNGVTYRRVDYDAPIIKFKRVGESYRGTDTPYRGSKRRRRRRSKQSKRSKGSLKH